MDKDRLTVSASDDLVIADRRYKFSYTPFYSPDLEKADSEGFLPINESRLKLHKDILNGIYRSNCFEVYFELTELLMISLKERSEIPRKKPIFYEMLKKDLASLCEDTSSILKIYLSLRYGSSTTDEYGQKHTENAALKITEEVPDIKISDRAYTLKNLAEYILDPDGPMSAGHNLLIFCEKYYSWYTNKKLQNYDAYEYLYSTNCLRIPTDKEHYWAYFYKFVNMTSRELFELVFPSFSSEPDVKDEILKFLNTAPFPLPSSPFQDSVILLLESVISYLFEYSGGKERHFHNVWKLLLDGAETTAETDTTVFSQLIDKAGDKIPGCRAKALYLEFLQKTEPSERLIIRVWLETFVGRLISKIWILEPTSFLTSNRSFFHEVIPEMKLTKTALFVGYDLNDDPLEDYLKQKIMDYLAVIYSDRNTEEKKITEILQAKAEYDEDFFDLIDILIDKNPDHYDADEDWDENRYSGSFIEWATTVH